jgi:hypothetical protein
MEACPRGHFLAPPPPRPEKGALTYASSIPCCTAHLTEWSLCRYEGEFTSRVMYLRDGAAVLQRSRRNTPIDY